jgi:S1-C subfamily serine protease
LQGVAPDYNAMRRYALLLLGLLLTAACDPVPSTALKLVTIESAESGLSLRELPPQTLKSIGLPFGLAVVKAGGLAERAGLKIGDVVYGINQKKVRNLEEFNRLLAAQQGGSTVGLLVRRGRSDFYVPVDLAGAAPRDSTPKGLPSARDTLLRT